MAASGHSSAKGRCNTSRVPLSIRRRLGVTRLYRLCVQRVNHLSNLTDFVEPPSMLQTAKLTVAEILTYSDGRDDTPPDLRFLHYNDVYHVEAGSREPVGGIARFQTICNHYAKDERFRHQANLITFFSGDAFNPSLESSVTKGAYRELAFYP